MRPVLNERKCPMQGQICKAIPACPEGAIGYIVDDNAPLGGRIVFDYEKCNRVRHLRHGMLRLSY